jgi:hypothetical protein
MNLGEREVRLLAASLGLGMLAVGIFTVFAQGNGAGSAALITIGILLLVVAGFADRIELIELGGAKLQLRDLARRRFALASQEEKKGDTQAAANLRRQAHALQRLAGTYERLRRSMPGGSRRTGALDEVMRQARRFAQETKFDPADVWTWFEEGNDAARVVALGLMLGDKDLRDFFAALDAIEHSRSAFEQYYGLRVARMMIPDLSEVEQDWLAAAVRSAQHTEGFQSDTSRKDVSKEILRELGENAESLQDDMSV